MKVIPETRRTTFDIYIFITLYDHNKRYNVIVY